VRRPDGRLEALALGLRHAEPVEVHDDRARVEDAHDDGLAPDDRQRRHAQVDVVAVDGQTDAPVLRHALLGDVELGHDLDPGHEAGDQMARHRRRVEDDAVDAEANAHVVPARLEVDVGGAAAHCVGDHRVHELDDGRLVRRLAQLDDLGLGLLGLDLADRPLERAELLDQGVDVLRGGDRAAHLVARGHRDVVEGEQVGRVGGGHEQRPLGQEGDRHGAVAASLLAVDHARGALVDVERVQVDVIEVVSLGECLRELPGVDDPGLDQGLAERTPVTAPVLDDPLDDLPLGEAELDDDVPDAPLGVGPLGGRY
jgi:hypothetical protein